MDLKTGWILSGYQEVHWSIIGKEEECVQQTFEGSWMPTITSSLYLYFFFFIFGTILCNSHGVTSGDAFRKLLLLGLREQYWMLGGWTLVSYMQGKCPIHWNPLFLPYTILQLFITFRRLFKSIGKTYSLLPCFQSAFQGPLQSLYSLCPHLLEFFFFLKTFLCLSPLLLPNPSCNWKTYHSLKHHRPVRNPEMGSPPLHWPLFLEEDAVLQNIHQGRCHPVCGYGLCFYQVTWKLGCSKWKVKIQWLLHRSALSFLRFSFPAFTN